MKQDPILTLAEAIQKKQSAVIATVVEVKGASPAKVGARNIAQIPARVMVAAGIKA